jgi:4-alpha-glucanotransferase
MNVSLKLPYKTSPDRDMYVSGSTKELGKWDVKKALKLICKYEMEWSIDIDVSKRSEDIEYKYFIADANIENVQWEAGPNRVLKYFSEFDIIDVNNHWHEDDKAFVILNKPVFGELIFKRDKADTKVSPKKAKSKTEKTLIFQVYAPKLDSRHKLCISGSIDELGNWVHADAPIMNYCGSSSWSAVIKSDKKYKNVFYKYGIYDTVKKEVITLETGKDRLFFKPLDDSRCDSILRIDDNFRYSDIHWHGAGVAIPVFSLRSKAGMGVGEFLDIKLLVDWCKKTGMKMIQILPVNDTIHTHTWVDSYPYSAISVFALHPMYLNLQAIGDLPSKTTYDIINERIETLNKNEVIDYEAVMNIKSRFFLLAYEANKKLFHKDRNYKKFFKENKEWLVPYAAYCYLRDLFGTHDYTKWGIYAKYNIKLINKLCDPTAEQFDDIAIHYFIQYHLHKQLLEAVEYARANGVVLKGDIPIGVNRYGIDTWTEPKAFNMNGQAGAPPDDYAVDGQNWGFPTYNWEEMAKDGFIWWKKRLKQLSTYFDAFRIDHILGFFRIWEIPYDAVSGLLGYFRPAVPIKKSELDSLNIGFNEERFCKPYIRSSYIKEKLGTDAQKIIDNYLIEENSGCFKMRPGFETQREVEEYFTLTPDMSEEERASKTKTKKILFSLIGEVLFIKDADQKNCYHPRISINKTSSYAELGEDVKNKVYNLYLDYFYHRQESLWREQAMIKLPALINATNMLVCGEDLGMVPNCVPGVMDELNLLSLKIQRMPKEEHLDFGIPSDYPYMSVCTPSCHDMSTVRGWWEDDKSIRQKFYNNMLGHGGEAPENCEPWICDEIILQHLYSPSMWAVFPIQDLLATNAELRRENPNDEKINEPSNPKHYWRYRFHIPIEKLLKEEALNKHIHDMVEASGRDTVTY